MQTIEISNVTGSGVYDVYICDMSLTFCQSVVSSVSIPPNYTFVLTGVFNGVTSVIIKLVDTASGCEKFIPYYCPTATPTPTITPTPSKTPSTCLCITIDNPTSSNLPFNYVDCSSITIYSIAPSASTIYVCGNSPSGDMGLSISVNTPCVDGSCAGIPATPTPTPTPTQTPTQTPTPTQSSGGGGNNKIFQGGDNFIFMVGDFYIFENQ